MSCHLHGSEPALGVSASNKIELLWKKPKFDHLRFANITSQERAYQGQPTSLEIWLHLEITWLACQSATNGGLVRFCFVPRMTGRFSRTGKRVANCTIIRSLSGRLMASSGTLDGDDTAIGTFDHRLRRTFDHRGLFWMCPHLVKEVTERRFSRWWST